jgi:hypothetical protein
MRRSFSTYIYRGMNRNATARLHDILTEKTDKLDELRNSLRVLLHEKSKLSQIVATQSKQIRILSDEKQITQQRLNETSNLAKRLDIKLNITNSRLDTSTSNENLSEKYRDVRDRLELAKLKMSKQAEALHGLSRENAVLNRAISLHCQDADESVDSLRENACLSLQVEELRDELDQLGRDRSEKLELQKEVERLSRVLDRESAKSEFLESQVKLVTQLKQTLVEEKNGSFLAKAKECALVADNARLSDSIKQLRQVISTHESSLLAVGHQVETSQSSYSEEKRVRESLERENWSISSWIEIERSLLNSSRNQ